ncbi:MAG TPA: hypothetical protein VJ725_15010 [Thermoanaerobaculia bacterium]|nr:hypothetical protein [Thermoanaerobaculia bacterium]
MNRDNVSRADAAAAFTAPAAVDRLQRLGLIVGVIGAVLCAIGFFVSPEYFFRSWLVGWVYWMGVTLGCFAIMMLHHLSRGAWGLVVRRVMEAASRTLPWLLLLSLPILLDLLTTKSLYLWSRPIAGDELLQAKAPYLNVWAYLLRLVIYFAVWGGFAFVLNRMSLKQDTSDDPGLTRRMQLIAAFGLAAYCLAVTFASVDWLMSLDPHWFSTIYGVYLMGSQGLAALAFIITFALFLSRREPMAGVIQPRHFHDWGKLFLAFVMLWAYFSFSQFLIIWSGNLPEEIEWYLKRLHGGWGLVALLLVLFHFALPFVLLLSRDLKRSGRLLVGVAVLMLVMRWVDLLWQVEPNFEEHHVVHYWLYLAAPAAIGGIWLFLFVHELKKRPILPINDPYLPEAIAHNGH